jgi:outer membrane protein assembly factor BamB
MDDRTVQQDDLPLAVAGDTGFLLGSRSFEALSLSTGEVLARFDPDSPSEFPEIDPQRQEHIVEESEAVPLVLDIDGRQRFVVFYWSIVPGDGLQAEREVIEIMTVSADDLSVQTIDVPETASDRASQFTVAGAHGTTAVLAFDRSSVAVDVVSGEVLWRSDDTAAEAVNGGIVVGSRYDADLEEEFGDGAVARQTLRGLDVDGGDIVWEYGKDGSVRNDGSNALVVTADRIFLREEANPFDLEDGASLHVLDATSGELIVEHSIDVEQCVFDGQHHVACSLPSNATLYGPQNTFGLDAATGEVLWQLTEDEAAGTLAAEVVTAWHGAVYGRSANGALVLDAATGDVLHSDPGMVPLYVDDRLGIGAGEDKQLTVAPAVE